KSHSLLRLPQSIAAPFKRRYRNCPGRITPRWSALRRRASSDTTLTFFSGYRKLTRVDDRLKRGLRIAPLRVWLDGAPSRRSAEGYLEWLQSQARADPAG